MRPTKRQREFVRAVKRLTSRRGFAPSYSEIADELGVSRARVQALVKRCTDIGLVSQEFGVARSVCVR